MKFLIFTLLIIACAHAIPAPLLTTTGDGTVINIDHSIELDPGTAVNLGVKDKRNLQRAVNNLSTVAKEPVAWAVGTVTGLAHGAVNAVTGGLKGLAHGGLGGLLSEATSGLAKGAAHGFANSLGATMNS